MFLLDTLLIGGLRFVFDKLATAVDTERNDPTRLREILLEAEMQREAGELSAEEFSSIEADVFEKLRALGEGGLRQPIEMPTGAQAEIELGFDGGDPVAAQEPEAVPAAKPHPRAKRKPAAKRKARTRRTPRSR